MDRAIEIVEVFEVATDKNFNEKQYLEENPDVWEAVRDRKCKSAYHHFNQHGRKEGRKQKRTDYHQAIQSLRQKKAKRLQGLFKEGLNLQADANHVFDYTNQARKQQFGFTETDKVSSFFYDQVPLDIINRLPDGMILDCGAGFRTVYYENVVNYEIVPYPTTDVIGFAEELPFSDNSFDAVFSFAVLEHVKYPFQAAREMSRVLKPGGTMAVSCAFLQPRHGYPHHYFNMTDQGLKVLFEDELAIDMQQVRPGTGPISTLTWLLRDWAAGLDDKSRKQFMKMKIGDFFKQPKEYQHASFVENLPPTIAMDLACATLLLGTKK